MREVLTEAPSLTSKDSTVLLLTIITAAEAANCPVHAFVGQAESVVFWDDTAGTYTFVDQDSDWYTALYSTPPTTTDWSLDFTGVAPTTVGNYEMTIGITSTGSLGAFGYNVTSGLPSGSEPYASPAIGSTGRFSVLDSSGTVVNWGNAANSWLTSEPTATGFTALDVGRDVGCAVSEVNNTGVTCWGYDLEGMIASASRPTSGYYQSVSVGRYVVVAVDTSGNTHAWCTTRSSSGATGTCANFIANMPPSGVRSVEVSETGELVGVAWNADGTATIWQDPAKGLQYALKSAPGFEAYASNTDRTYTPEGPSGFITFVTQPHVAIYPAPTAVGAVIDNPQGLVDLRVGTYAYGDAVMWNSTSITSGGVPHYQPQRIDACD